MTGDGGGGGCKAAPSVPYASLVVSRNIEEISLQFVNFPETKSNGHWKGFSRDAASEVQVVHHSNARRTFVFGGVKRSAAKKEKGEKVMLLWGAI